MLFKAGCLRCFRETSVPTQSKINSAPGKPCAIWFNRSLSPLSGIWGIIPSAMMRTGLPRVNQSSFLICSGQPNAVTSNALARRLFVSSNKAFRMVMIPGKSISTHCRCPVSTRSQQHPDAVVVNLGAGLDARFDAPHDGRFYERGR